MATQVRDTAAGSSVTAVVIMNKKGKHVATVQSVRTGGGTVTVDVWAHGDAACLANYSTARRNGRITPEQWEKRVGKAPSYYHTREAAEQWAAFDAFGLQQGRAGGGGYDKFAAALAGAIIDGHTIADHCGQVPEDEKARARLLAAQLKAGARTAEERKAWNAKADRIGAHFCNWDDTRQAFGSLHFVQGLQRLEAFGYQIITAI